MTAPTVSLHELNQQALDALTRALGVVGTIRFLNQFATGHGDYTADRAAWLEDAPALDALIEQARHLDAERDANARG